MGLLSLQAKIASVVLLSAIPLPDDEGTTCVIVLISGHVFGRFVAMNSGTL